MTTLLSGWGRVPVVPGQVILPTTWAELPRLLAQPWIARGLGRSYGDAAVPAVDGGVVLGNTGLDRFLAFDPASGLLTAEAGVSLATIIEHFQPRGFFLPTTPGTKFVTLGGAVAADVHGKNHHVDGSFSAHVTELVLALPSGEIRSVTPANDPHLFWASVGGMGLTGFILAVTLRLRRVPSAWYRVRYERAGGLDRALARLAEEDQGHRYSVAWIDCLARGAALGRSVLMLGNDAEPEELPRAYRDRPMSVPRKGRKTVPFDFPSWALGSWSVSAFNQAFYWKHGDGTKIVDYDTFFYPLDAVHQWNRIYGTRGFIQFQAWFPDTTAAAGLRQVLEAISDARLASFLAVLKRSGAAGPGWLSYLAPGFTLALDIPFAADRIHALHERLQAILLAHQGRIYFAKDTLGSAAAVQAMYPRLDEFRQFQAKLDPHGRVRSRLAVRLGLVG